MNILIYSLNFFPRSRGGMEKFLFYLIQGLKKKHKIILLTPNKNNIALEGAKVALTYNFSNSDVIKGISETLSILIKLPFILIKNKINLVSIFSIPPSGSIIAIIARLLRKKVVVNFRGVNLLEKKYFVVFEDLCIYFSNYIFGNATELFDQYKQISYLPPYIYSQKPKIYLPNGIGYAFWQKFKQIHSNAPKKYDVSIVANLLAFNRWMRKGISYLYQALKIIKTQYGRQLKVVVIGDCQLLLGQQLIKDFDPAFFDFVGSFTDKRKYAEKILESKIFVLSSLTEGMPNSLMEAMCLGMPCIATNVGAVPNLITDGESGIIVPSKNSNKLASAIWNLLNDQDLMEKIGHNAEIKMKNEFSWPRILKKYENAFQTIIYH